MDTNIEPAGSQPNPQQSPSDALAAHLSGGKRRKYSRFTLAALGSIPWVGGVLGAVASLGAENDQGTVNEMQREWLVEHREKIKELGETIARILSRIDSFGEEVQDRIESDEYLTLVRKAFRSWDQADTQEKRELIANLLMNAGGTKLCPDDLVRLFISWIDTYHEAHFRVIREIHQNPGSTRGRIWDAIADKRPREDSAEADLYKLLIRDLSTGGVIRQVRETDAYGQFLKRPRETKQHSSGVLTSAFDDKDPYELTELGRQFVHYTMNDLVTRIGGPTAS